MPKKFKFVDDFLSSIDDFNGPIDCAIVPPLPDDNTDEEDVDEDSGVGRDVFDNISNEYLPEVCGDIDVFVNDDENTETDNESEEDTPPAKRRKTTNKKTSNTGKGKKKGLDEELEWKREDIADGVQYENIEGDNIEKLQVELGHLTKFEFFKLFFDDKVCDLIMKESVKYSQQENVHNFSLDSKDLHRFVGILFLTGYHSLPLIQHYWSNDPDKGLSIVRQSMTRNRFQQIKRFLHFCDNQNIDKNDPFFKVRPLFNILNMNFMQFGVWAHTLSIDEEMVPYFGRHSAKMFIKGKPVRYGFKLWCLASASGYLFSFYPYAGASEKRTSGYLLGEEVVLKLVENIAVPKNHRLFFDNYFTSLRLMKELKDMGLAAAGTIQENRLRRCNMISSGSVFKKKDKGYMEVATRSDGICLTKWRDNNIVNFVSNFAGMEPQNIVRRRQKQKKGGNNMIKQPAVAREYNIGMGGVDAHDNGIANYRITTKAAKFYWSLWKNSLSQCMVNAWKLYQIVNESSISQIDFISEVTRTLLAYENKPLTAKGSDNDSDED